MAPDQTAPIGEIKNLIMMMTQVLFYLKEWCLDFILLWTPENQDPTPVLLNCASNGPQISTMMYIVPGKQNNFSFYALASSLTWFKKLIGFF